MDKDQFSKSLPLSNNIYFSVLSSSWLMIVAALLFMGISWYVLEQYLRDRGEERFENSVQELTEAVNRRMLAYEQVLRGGVGLLLSSSNVTRQEWQTYVINAHLSEYYPGFQGFGYAQLLQPEALSAHIQQVQAEGFKDYKVYPEGMRDQYCVIVYLEPFDWRNQRALGYDMCSESNRYKAITRAITTGLPTVSGKVVLVQDTSDDAKAGFLMYLPLYQGTTTTEAERKQHVFGLVYAAFRMDDLMQGIMGERFSGLKLAIYESPQASADSLMFTSSKVAPNEQDVFYHSQTDLVGGQLWRLDISSQSRFISRAEQTQGMWLQFIGCGFILALFYSVLIMARNRYKESLLTSELIANEKRFRLVIEASPSALFMVNKSGFITLVNTHAERLFGYTRDELLGRSINMLLPETLRDAHQQHMSNYLVQPIAKNMSMRDDLFGCCKDGSRLAIEVGLTPIHFSNGISILATINNVSERKRIEVQRAEHMLELERINQELDRFAYIASHDLKSPLRGIEQLTSWLSEDLVDNTNENVQKYLGLIQSRIHRMVLLLDGLLMFSRIGRVDTETTEVKSRQLVEDMFALVAPPQGFELVLKGEFPNFYTVRPLLELVIRNLISNAIKHHDLGTGVITVSCEAIDQQYRFSVIDDGPGISSSYHEKVFEMFQTLKPRDEVEGSGLGLSLVRKTVESLGGEIQLKSQGRGCCFCFSWPKKIVKKELL
ncbi:CHASE domain-containing protein [Shewanella sp. SM34]|uniref:CHASE domain-containing sensor histidine kinase n=1 Tax=unclassified Shewanella TaxID=196818 RepID=UPI0021D9D1B2|nr:MULTISPECIES: CHASE domain-containing protein [unclassified Shewanella]MCU8055185.1 CHASE domain-containing protein [Shewanella sp. SM35]MCU8063746.1 CHASE domain-containing protein [Shewanella sp. SM34]